MHKVLVSACLVGEPVRYDGTAATSTHPVLLRWLREERVVPCCPELLGGLGTPRVSVELVGSGRVQGREGEDLTGAFVAGAQAAVDLCLRLGIRVAVLKDRSPSCGSAHVHDGTFSGALVPGQGLAAAALRGHGVAVFSEHQWEAAQACLGELDAVVAASKGTAGGRSSSPV